MKQLVILLLTSCLTTNSGFTISGPLSQPTLPPFFRKSVSTDVVGLINKPHHLWKNTNQHLFPTTTNNDEDTTNNNNEETILATKSGAVNEAEMKKNNWLSTNTKTLKNLALSLLLVVCLTFAPLVQQSLAVESGGRMGGSFSRQQSSSPSYSRSYSRPSPSIRSYSYSSPTVIRPYYSPFGYGGYGGGVTVVRRGPSFFDVIVFAGVAFTLFSVFSKSSSSSTLDWPSKSSTSALGPGFSVIQISVAVNVPKRDSPSSVLSKLDYLAETAQTDSRVGLQNLVSEVSLELLRQTQSVVSVSSSYSHYNDYNKAQRDYNKLSIRERSKFQRETVSNYKGVDYSDRSRRALTPSSNQLPQATVAVITLVLCIEGDSTKIPSTIRSTSDLQNALSRISSDAVTDSCLQGAEILWTPQDRMETLSLQDVIADYPDLRTI